MPTPSKDFREDCNRAIYVSGKIDQDLLHRLSPEINKLRLHCTDPITIYIDSVGGSTMHAEHIRQLVQVPHPDGGRCRTITVVTGSAVSAAADMLALGDYAIAFPHSFILYHGARRSPESLTYEGASSLASSLQQTNERYAVKLAHSAFPRFCFRLSQSRDELQQYISQPESGMTLSITQLADSLAKKLSSQNVALVREAEKKQELIENLTSDIPKHVRRRNLDKLSAAQVEAEILKAIVDHKTKLHKREVWSVGKQGLNEVANDFKLVYDFHFGMQKKSLESFSPTLGRLFLLDEEQNELKQVVESEQAQWLATRVTSRLHSLWYFVVSYCRLLQTADYALLPVDAYWLGLVDEVRGSGLPNLREMVESLPANEIPPAPETSPVASTPADPPNPT